MPRKPKRRSFAKTFAACLLTGVVVVGGGVFAAHVLSPVLVNLALIPNNKVVDFHTYFTLDPDVTTLVMEDTRIAEGENPVYENGEVYLPLSRVKNFDPFIFWDEFAETLFVTTDTEVLSFKEEDLMLKGDVVYIPASLLSTLYPYIIEYREEYNIVVTDHMTASRNTGRFLKDTYVRYRADKLSDVALKAEKNMIVTVYGTDEYYTKVRTADGLLGYALTEDIGLLTLAEAEALEKPEMPEPLLDDYIVNTLASPPVWRQSEPITLVWDSIDNPDGTAIKTETPLPVGLDVISPTWFELTAESTELKNSATSAYVSWAHDQGAQVWPRVFDLNGENAHAFLTDASARARVVSELCGYISEYGLDGLNVDFEFVRESEADYFVQFLRELSVGMGDAVLSIDVPMYWTELYRKGDISLFADYLCVMAYDEHVRTSPSSGPVASLRFVEDGINMMLRDVPANKILLGLPFYNRVWRELSVNDSPETRQTSHYGMERTKQLLIDNEVTPEWDSETGYFYGEYALVEGEETVRYRIWLEDENSIKEKLRLFTEYGLAGVAGWQRGFENAAVWGLINELE